MPALDELTQPQIDCLMLVRDGRTSKEMARLLGVSKTAIDQRLDRARSILGASTREEAARIYAEGGYDRVTCDPPEIVYTTIPASFNVSAEADGGSQGSQVQEVRASFEVAAPPTWTGLLRLFGEVEPKDIGTTGRVALALFAALAAVMLFGGLSLFLYAILGVGRVLLN
ncbi:helix-turn-helix transcriptional regulator [Sphingomonas sp. S2-65]|uniref:helix-turn-helix transcriptional regulator n=1 Tax=Sphingomonas sp. S2-65 TaxID=2903960 RepID=UPI0021BC6B92|nr:sigma factor-like helix-turn-helix DNA-binding protein [Sphingomonas sp. S2-65]UYY57028.1 hypothetical protein LZ586_10050 [Sphingomonas sp. S2-65]